MLLKNNNYQVKWFSSFEPKTSIESTEEFYDIKHVWERNCVYHISLLAIHHIKYCIKGLKKSYHVETCLILFHLAFVVVQSLSHVWLCVTPRTAVHQASLPFTISQNLFKLMSTEWVLPPNHHLILCHSLLFLLSIFPNTRVFSIDLAVCIRWSNYWSISFSISPSNEYLGMIPFRIDWFDLLAV